MNMPSEAATSASRNRRRQVIPSHQMAKHQCCSLALHPRSSGASPENNNGDGSLETHKKDHAVVQDLLTPDSASTGSRWPGPIGSSRHLVNALCPRISASPLLVHRQLRIPLGWRQPRTTVSAVAGMGINRRRSRGQQYPRVRIHLQPLSRTDTFRYRRQTTLLSQACLHLL